MVNCELDNMRFQKMHPYQSMLRLSPAASVIGNANPTL